MHLAASHHDTVRALLEQHVSPLQRQLRGATLASLARELVALEPQAEPGEAQRLAALVLRMKQLAERQEQELEHLDQRWQEFAQLYFGHGDASHRRALLADHINETVSDVRQRRADLAALERALDFDALRERHMIQRHKILCAIEIAVTFVGRASEAALAGAAAHAAEVLSSLVQAGRIDVFLRAHGESGPRWQIRHAALDGLIRVVRGARRTGLGTRFETEHLGAAVRSATNVDEHAWVQGTALELVLCLSHDVGVTLMARRLLDRAASAPRRDFLVRRQAVDLLADCDDEEALSALRRTIWAGDPSEHVRLGLADAIAKRQAPAALALLRPLLGLASEDAAREISPRVRAAAVAAACRAATATPARAPEVLELLLALLARETEILPLTVACEDAAALALAVPEARTEPLLAALVTLSARAGLPPAAHEAAAAAAEVVFRALHPERHAWTVYLAQAARRISPGRARTVSLRKRPAALPPLPDDPSFLGRILADLSRRDFALAVTRRGDSLILRRGDRFRRRLWRILHELGSLAPNKRQAFLHTVGRIPRGELRAPPGGLEEITATVVPGERVFVAQEGGWGRHLPTVDDFLDLPLLSADPVRIFSSHGTTTIRPPASFTARARARLGISRRYAELAALRTFSLAGSEARERLRFVDELRQSFGIVTEFERHTYDATEARLPAHLASLFSAPVATPVTPIAPAPPAVQTAALPISQALALAPGGSAFLGQARDWLEQHGYYFLSLEENSQLALVLFLAGFTALFFLEAFWKRRRIERARQRIPLTIGGWGTRGKSGTERLKAAVFHGLGYEVFVKTTGCEAMLIHSVPDEPAHEVFIFRSYDKSSIWEQRDMLELAADLDSEVYLWECMALNPQFVELMQREWMRDDLVTLTNAFPDHEDIQGPAGVNVAECISSFIPYDSTLVTSEVNFLPLFAERCKERGTRLHAVSTRDADLIADDVLALFPYNEHPRNIALVARVGAQFGIDRHLAIATMAEHVVPDLGVLKAYPAARVRGRVLRFMNGMSANERTGFLNNWQRMGLNTKDLVGAPGETVVTVVNNRWDRVSRSEVFARILVEDAVADAHVLIGTNLRGLRSFVDEALARHLPQLEVVVADDLRAGSQQPIARLAHQLGRLRVPTPEPEQVLTRVALYAAGAGLEVARDLAPLVRELCTPAADAPTGLAEVSREVSARLAPLLDEALVHHPRAGAAAATPPEVLDAPTREDVIAHVLRQCARIVVHARLRARLEALLAHGAASDAAALAAYHTLFRSAYRELFHEQLVVVSDAAETGDQIIDRCARAVPPGTSISVMGIQNIKGTGLDFVYRWQALDETTARLAVVADAAATPEQRLAALRELESFEDYGLVDAGAVVAALSARASSSVALDAAEQAQQERTLVAVRTLHEARRRALGQAARKDVWSQLCARVEAWLDPLDSMRRYRRARQVMRDLVAHRISHARAAKEMRSLYDRQKGGWLEEALRGSGRGASDAA